MRGCVCQKNLRYDAFSLCQVRRRFAGVVVGGVEVLPRRLPRRLPLSSSFVNGDSQAEIF